MLPPRHRLRERADFTAAVRGPGGARSGSRLMVVHARTTDTRMDQPARVGFVVSKAVGHAVVRNRTKRRLRALVSGLLPSIPGGTDVVVRANPAAAEATGPALAAELERLLARALAGRARQAPA